MRSVEFKFIYKNTDPSHVGATAVQEKTTPRYAFIEYKSGSSAQRAVHEADQMRIDDRKVLVVMECERELKGWIPRRLGGGFGGKKESGQLRFGGTDRPFKAPIILSRSHDHRSEPRSDSMRPSTSNFRSYSKDSQNRSPYHSRTSRSHESGYDPSTYKSIERAFQHKSHRHRSRSRDRDSSRSSSKRGRSRSPYNHRNRASDHLRSRSQSQDRSSNQDSTRHEGDDRKKHKHHKHKHSKHKSESKKHKKHRSRSRS